MSLKPHYAILKESSKTFYYSSRILPKKVMNEVAIIYAFLRTVDNLVDVVPADKETYLAFKNDYYSSLEKVDSKNPVINEFIKVQYKKNFDQSWIDSLFTSMEMDLDKQKYPTMRATLDYIYGVAEIVGLMMCKILNLKPEAYESAKALGRAVQYGNIIRDVAEDNFLGRRYFPQEELEKFGITDLSEEFARTHFEKFNAFMQAQIAYYFEWLNMGKKGFKYIPYRYRVTVKTASDLYEWTVKQIQKDPMRVFQGKIKPTKNQVIYHLAKNLVG